MFIPAATPLHFLHPLIRARVSCEISRLRRTVSVCLQVSSCAARKKTLLGWSLQWWRSSVQKDQECDQKTPANFWSGSTRRRACSHPECAFVMPKHSSLTVSKQPDIDAVGLMTLTISTRCFDKPDPWISFEGFSEEANSCFGCLLSIRLTASCARALCEPFEQIENHWAAD